MLSSADDLQQPLFLYAVASATILVILVVIAFLRRKYSATAQDHVLGDQSVEDVEPVEDGPPRRIPPPAAQVRRVGGSRTVRSRLRGRTHDQPTSHGPVPPPFDDDDFDHGSGGGDDDDESDDGDNELADFPDSKIGVKKRKKLEMKAEKKAIREQELHEREERKKRQELLDEQRRKDDEVAKQEEAKRVELERLQKEEKQRQEREEYLKMKESFVIESEGFDHEDGEDDANDLLKQFTQHIKDKKVVYLEDLAAHFRLKTQEAIDRVNSLMKSGDLTGVIDDRGKFIYISMEELESVAKFIKQRGRVTITELAESSNQLINMNPASSTADSASAASASETVG